MSQKLQKRYEDLMREAAYIKAQLDAQRDFDNARQQRALSDREAYNQRLAQRRAEQAQREADIQAQNDHIAQKNQEWSEPVDDPNATSVAIPEATDYKYPVDRNARAKDFYSQWLSPLGERDFWFGSDPFRYY